MIASMDTVTITVQTVIALPRVVIVALGIARAYVLLPFERRAAVQPPSTVMTYQELEVHRTPVDLSLVRNPAKRHIEVVGHYVAGFCRATQIVEQRR